MAEDDILLEDTTDLLTEGGDNLVLEDSGGVTPGSVVILGNGMVQFNG